MRMRKPRRILISLQVEGETLLRHRISIPSGYDDNWIKRSQAQIKRSHSPSTQLSHLKRLLKTASQNISSFRNGQKDECTHESQEDISDDNIRSFIDFRPQYNDTTLVLVKNKKGCIMNANQIKKMSKIDRFMASELVPGIEWAFKGSP